MLLFYCFSLIFLNQKLLSRIFPKNVDFMLQKFTAEETLLNDKSVSKNVVYRDKGKATILTREIKTIKVRNIRDTDIIPQGVQFLLNSFNILKITFKFSRNQKQPFPDLKRIFELHIINC